MLSLCFSTSPEVCQQTSTVAHAASEDSLLGVYRSGLLLGGGDQREPPRLYLAPLHPHDKWCRTGRPGMRGHHAIVLGHEAILQSWHCLTSANSAVLTPDAIGVSLCYMIYRLDHKDPWVK